MVEAGSDIKYILREDVPVLSSKGMALEETGEVLKKSTVISGDFMDKLVRDPQTKQNYRVPVIRMNSKKKQFIPAASANIFIDAYASSDGSDDRERLLHANVKATGFKMVAVKYGVPVLAAGAAYLIAKKRQMKPVGMIMLMVTFAAVGTIPYFNMKASNKIASNNNNNDNDRRKNKKP